MSDTILVVGIIFNIAIIWVLGLSIPLILRFVIFKRPLSKIIAFVLVTAGFFIQNFIATIFESKGTSFFALEIAIVSYFIIRKSIKTKFLQKYCKKCGNEISISATKCDNCGKEIIIRNNLVV